MLVNSKQAEAEARMANLLNNPSSLNEVEQFLVQTSAKFAEEVYKYRKDMIDLEYRVWNEGLDIAEHLAGPLETVVDEQGNPKLKYTEEYIHALHSWVSICLFMVKRKINEGHIK